MRDGGSAGTPASADVLSAGGYTVDIDALRATANVVLGLADRVDSVGDRRAMHSAQEYGYPLSSAATGWAQRFAYLLDGPRRRGRALRVRAAGYRRCLHRGRYRG